ncbi:3-oxoacid CoA-transferase subunit A [Mammaliicoccus sciuri]|uniref:3-oxoadipate CoA-transferase alpha subunit n=1 Tax=Sporosarcina newyorkensis TaxID=759851 RepID=A0A1T4XYY7_9BACL|nr:3-oxoacid CoA-transferase subunit A [Sporosarcina newyorkensis]SKA94760.1 3-oxoadipate CoA-transferase alpha subunit [Sporosarcina newyorkensis]
MINKVINNIDEAIEGVRDGSSILIGGQTNAGVPDHLLKKLLDMNVKNLTLITNHTGLGHDKIAQLIENRQVRKVICSFPKTNRSESFQEMYKKGEIELEVVPQGTLSERIRAGGAGIGGFYTKTGVGTLLADGKETKTIDGMNYLLELPIKADFAFIRGHQADRWGNIVYRKAARNYNPGMALAGEVTIAEVEELVDYPLDPEIIITPGIYVNRIIELKKGAVLVDSN